MIRTTCAWILLLLAASPVTAPFAVCDLRALLAHDMSHGLSPLMVPFDGAAATRSVASDRLGATRSVSRPS